MKFVERISLTIFSVIMLLISVINCLLIFGWLKLGTINIFITNILNNSVYSNAILTFSVIIILLAIKCIFFNYSNDKYAAKSGNGILLENDNGKLMVSKETLVNIVNSVAKGFESTQNVLTRVTLDKQSNLRIFVELYVEQNAVIKELSANLQKRIKEQIKKTIDLEVKEVNIKIKNITIQNQNQ